MRRTLKLARILPLILGACIAHGGCSIVFDENADDIALVDERRDISRLWRSPDGYSVLGLMTPTANFNRDDNLPDYSLLDPQKVQPPLYEGADGQIYWSFTGHTPQPIIWRNYHVPQGTLAQELAADNFAWSAAPNYMFYTRPRPPLLDGKVVLATLGLPIVEARIPASHTQVLNTAWSVGAIVSCDAKTTPRTFQIAHYESGHQLLRTTFDWPKDVDAGHTSGCAQFSWNASARTLVYISDDNHLWLQPPGGAVEDLGLATLRLVTADKIFYFDETDDLWVYSVPLRARFALGVTRAAALHFDDAYYDGAWLVSCQANGVRSFSIEPLRSPAPQHQLDVRRCSRIVEVKDGLVTYEMNQLDLGFEIDSSRDLQIYVQYRVPIDGSAPSEPLPTWAPLGSQPFELARCASGLRAYSMNLRHAGRLVIRDGWISDWHFSDDASAVTFSRDCRRVRWKERVDEAGIGELLSAELPHGRPLRLARNVGRYFEQPDGRVLTQSNLIGIPEQSRLLIIDEGARQAHWLLDDASRILRAQLVLRINELLLDAIAPNEAISLSGHRVWYRLPLPPRR